MAKGMCITWTKKHGNVQSPSRMVWAGMAETLERRGFQGSCGGNFGPLMPDAPRSGTYWWYCKGPFRHYLGCCAYQRVCMYVLAASVEPPPPLGGLRPGRIRPNRSQVPFLQMQGEAVLGPTQGQKKQMFSSDGSCKGNPRPCNSSSMQLLVHALHSMLSPLPP